MKLNIISPTFLGTSGYSSHSKGLANALNKLCDVKITIQPMPNWNLMVNDDELKMISKDDSPDRINVIIDMPHNWNQYCNKQNNIGFLVWEGDKIPLSWIDCIRNDKISQVWVPSSHVYYAIQKTLTGEQYTIQRFMQKVKIVPHGFNPDIFKPMPSEEKRFIFLVNKGFRGELDRGGMQHAIKAFVQEFSKGEATLFLKLNPAYAIHPDGLITIINKYVVEAGKTKDNCPEIAFTYDNMNFDKLNELYNASKLLLNPTEAEAFSLPCIEAMACGKPIITSSFGGQTDFVSTHNGWIVSGEMHEVKNDFMYEGVSWQTPNIKELRVAMREAFVNNELRMNKASNALSTAQNWTWNNSALKVIEAINSLAVGSG